MSHHEFESYSEGEWEDRGDLVWNEFDWEKHLREHDNEVSKFRQLYDEHLDLPHHLDEIARKMGWESDDWNQQESSSSVEPQNLESEFSADNDSTDESLDEIVEEDMDPYTLHRHPVLIAQRGIVESFLEQVAKAPSMTDAASLSAIFRGLRKMEFNSFMALEALEVADYSLVIAHLKRGLNDVNFLFIPWEKLCVGNNGELDEKLLKAGQQRLFDLRELWLRVIHESREEIQNRHRDNS